MIVASLLVALGPHATPANDTWPQWRGPDRDGRAAGAAWPDALTEERLAVRWRVGELGPSYSGPIVAGDRVFTVETAGARDEIVRALDRETGEELWRTDWEGSMEVPFFAARNGSWIRATPAFDGDTLYVAGMRDVLVALDAETGEPRWRVDFVERYGTSLPNFGFVSSPLVVGEHVFVQAGAALVKLDKRTGRDVWRVLEDGGAMDSAFSSPILTELAGREQLVVLSRSHLSGVAPADGAVLWTRPIEAYRGMNILTPVPYRGGVLTAPYGGRAQFIGIVGGEGEELATEPAWTNRAQGYMTTPVVVDGHAYLFTRANRFHCIDLATGADAWISPPPGDQYWSLVVQGDRILALADTGLLRLLRANPEEYEVLGEVRVADEDTWAHLAVIGGELYVRSASALTALEWN